MNPVNSCPRCGRPSTAGVKFCSGCGSNLSTSPSGIGWKLFIGAFILLVGLVWASALYSWNRPATQLAGASQPQTLLGQSASPGASQSSPSPSPSLTLTSVQHLSEAKRALADGYKPNKDPQKAQWGEVAAAKWHLKAIGATAPEYRESQELLNEVARRERQIELARKQAEKNENIDEAATADAAGGASDDDSEEASSAASASPKYSAAPAPTAPRQSPPASTAGGGSSDDYYTNSRGVRVHRPVFSESGPPAGATAQCRDGSYSFSMSRRGTCSHHAGVAKWF
jgi:hypothetical protein